jgi:tRNA 5-methylaminomethyl-2-thiouridine biosynthesis bifunctional protein
LLHLADELQRAWPPATPDLHALAFDQGRVRLLLAWGDVAAVLPDLVAQVDAFYLDGFAPARNPAMWQPQVLQRLPRLAAPGATAATWSVARELRDGLAAGGFEVHKAPGFGGRRWMSVARFAPRFTPPLPPGRQPAAGGPGSPAAQGARALIVGAGLAGCATAFALQAQGLQCTVLEAGAGPASRTSGNLGGLLHGTLHADDGPHARWLRACALHAQRLLAPWVAEGHLPGQLHGLLRLEQQLAPAAMQALLQAQALPPNYVQALDGPTASAAAGTALPGPAWLYPGAGWVSPAALCSTLLQHSGAQLRTATRVHALRRLQDQWQLLDEDGQLLDQAPLLVLANAHDAQRLLAAGSLPASARVRGQVSVLPAGTPGLPALQLPVAGTGYALRLPDGRLLCGATTQHHDEEATLRPEDHRHNLQRLAQLTGFAPGEDGAGTALAGLDGRVGWRQQVSDRLPLLGAVPDLAAWSAAGARARRDQPRLVPRLPGLYVHAALGSRGIAQSLLGGELLAAWITGAPWPVPAPLADAVDAARFVARGAAA